MLGHQVVHPQETSSEYIGSCMHQWQQQHDSVLSSSRSRILTVSAVSGGQIAEHKSTCRQRGSPEWRADHVQIEMLS